MGARFARMLLVLGCASLAAEASRTHGEVPRELLSRGGLCVLIGGAENLARAEAMLEAGPWVVHWLDADAQAVENARRTLQQRGLYGRVAVEHWTADRLPYADNLANLVVALDAAPSPGRDELMRVLAPEGSAVFVENGRPVRLVKPRPAEMGEWTHPWHDADGSLASGDRAFEPPNAFQWIAGPPFPMAARKDSSGVLLSAGGRVFAITQNVPENLPGGGNPPNYLVARDAFNGTTLWSRRWEGPLSRGHAYAVHTAIVAAADRLYASLGNEVAVLDAASGETLASWPTAGPADKLLLSGGLLVAQTPGGLDAFDVARGRRVWRHEAQSPWCAVARDGRVFCLSSTREVDGRWRHDLLAVDLRNGERLWTQPVESTYGARSTAVLRLHFAGDGIVCLLERHLLRVLSAEDGRELWQRESGTEARGGGSMDTRQVGHFFVQGKLWMRMARGSGREGAEPWLALDPLTGEVVREVDAIGPKGVISNVNKVSCQPLTATERFVFDARLSTVWEFETGERGGWKFGRGGCQVGMVPANGLAYAPPNACGCLGEQLRANLAVVRTDDPGLHTFVPATLQRGPAYGMALAADAGNPGGWPTYRRDGRRGAHLPERLPAELRAAWRAPVATERADGDNEWRLQYGRRLTPPIVADGLVLVAEPQSHQVIALDASTGAARWVYTAGGRITLPPTLHRGLALFGAHDGYVYALRASDGALVWRRRAAPSDRRIMAYGQIESAWPVTGGVLIHDGLALAAAGRTADGDGGVVVHGMEPATGEVRWTSRVQGAQHGMGDLLVTDGDHVYLMNMRLDAQTGEVTEIDYDTVSVVREWNGAALRRVHYPAGVRYLRSGLAGFLDTSWTQLDMGLRKQALTWTWGESEGEILAFAEDHGYAFQIDAGKSMWSSPRTNGGGRIEAREAGADGAAWSLELPAPAQVEAMLLTPDALYLAGPANRAAPDGPGFLRAVCRKGGEILGEVPLSGPPVHDGIAAAGGNVYIVLDDGSVVCFGGDPSAGG